MHACLLLTAAWLAAAAGSSELSGPARVLLLPFPGLNHSAHSSMAHLGEELAGRGHEVHLLVGADYQEQQEMRQQGIMPVLYGGNSHARGQRGYHHHRRDVGEGAGRDGEYRAYDDHTRHHARQLRHACTEPLSDHDLFQKLRRMNFDIAVVDAHPVSRCLLVLPYRLGIPYISMVKDTEPWLQGNPDLPSFVPFIYGPYEYSDQMSFWERFNNLWSLVSWSYDPKIETHREDYLARFTPDKSPRDADDLAKDSQLWFVESDVVLEYPRPAMPNVIHVGGMTSKPGKRLPPDVQAFMDDAKGNVIIVDLCEDNAGWDSGFNNMPYDIEERLATAFQQTHYHYLWCYRGERPPVKYSNNRVKMVSWMPRNDVLAHSNTRLFITDGATNAQYEAIYHAVPSLVLAAHGGQAYAARRLVHRGYGVRLDAHTFTPAHAVDAIEEVMRNATYRHNTQKASSVFRSRHENPRERAGNWVEHALSHDMDYIRSHGQRLSQSAFSMFDVVSFLVVGHLVAGYVTYKVVAFSCRRLLCGRGRSRDEEDEDNSFPSGSGTTTSFRSSQYRSGGRGKKH